MKKLLTFLLLLTAFTACGQTGNGGNATGGSFSRPLVAQGGPLIQFVIPNNPGIPDFGSLAVNTASTPFTVTLKNIGTGTLVWTSVASNNADFAISTNNCTGQLPVNATCTLNLTF